MIMIVLKINYVLRYGLVGRRLVGTHDMNHNICLVKLKHI